MLLLQSGLVAGHLTCGEKGEKNNYGIATKSGMARLKNVWVLSSGLLKEDSKIDFLKASFSEKRKRKLICRIPLSVLSISVFVSFKSSRLAIEGKMIRDRGRKEETHGCSCCC